MPRDTGLFVAALWVGGECCRLPAVPDPEVESCWSCRIFSFCTEFGSENTTVCRIFNFWEEFGSVDKDSCRISGFLLEFGSEMDKNGK